MTEETPTPTPTPQPAPTPAPAPAPPVVSDEARKQAGYYARHPDEFEAVLSELEASGQVAIRAEVNNLRREITIRDAITDHGLTRADADFIRGNTPEEINASAAKLKARLEAATPSPTLGDKPPLAAPADVPTPKPAPTEPPPLPEHRGGRTSIEQAEADLLEACANTNWTELLNPRR